MLAGRVWCCSWHRGRVLELRQACVEQPVRNQEKKTVGEGEVVLLLALEQVLELRQTSVEQPE